MVVAIIASMVSEASDADGGRPERPSKTQVKAQMHALQELGEALLALPADRLAALELPERLRDALAHLRTIRSHEARRRQVQYVGKLMRSVDAAPIEAALERMRSGSRAEVALMHACEHWRDRLLDDDAALTAFAAEFPAAEIQPLRAAIRAARAERQAQRPPRHSRALYQMLRTQLSAPGPA